MYHVENSNRCTKCNGKGTRSAQVLLSQIPLKQLMLGRKMRGRTKEEHEELQDLDPMGSPHIEEKVIGGNVDLDLLSLFPQKLARIHGGIES